MKLWKIFDSNNPIKRLEEEQERRKKRMEFELKFDNNLYRDFFRGREEFTKIQLEISDLEMVRESEESLNTEEQNILIARIFAFRVWTQFTVYRLTITEDWLRDGLISSTKFRAPFNFEFDVGNILTPEVMGQVYLWHYIKDGLIDPSSKSVVINTEDPKLQQRKYTDDGPRAEIKLFLEKILSELDEIFNENVEGNPFASKNPFTPKVITELHSYIVADIGKALPFLRLYIETSFMFHYSEISKDIQKAIR